MWISLVPMSEEKPKAAKPSPEKPSAVSGVFRKPFTEQSAFFRGKLGNLIPTERWDDVDREQHDTGFMVAGAQKADLLMDLAVATDRAVTEGKSLEAFRKDFRSIVEKHGWHGWTGEDSKGGRAWRTRTIYRTNASTSYAAGRRAQLLSGDFPFWVYRHGGSQEPRPEHVAFDGLFLPPTHDFWTIFSPPSDWGCSCYVLGARSIRAAVRLGGDPDKKLPDDWDAIDPKTGVAKGAGKGWDYAPGASVAPIVQASAEKVRHWDYRIGKAFMEDVPDALQDAFATSYRNLPSVADDLRRYAQRVWRKADGNPGPGVIEIVRTIGLVGPRQAAAIAELTDDVPAGLASFDYSLAEYDVRHVRSHHGTAGSELSRGQLAVAPDAFGLLPRILAAPDSVSYEGRSETGEPLVRYVKMIDGARYTALFAVRKGRRTLALKTFYVGKGGDAPPRETS